MEVAPKMRLDLRIATRENSRRLENGTDSWARRVIQCPLHAFLKIAVARMLRAGLKVATQPRSRVLCRERFASTGKATAVTGVQPSESETVENITSMNYPRLPCVIFATAPRKQVNVFSIAENVKIRDHCFGTPRRLSRRRVKERKTLIELCDAIVASPGLGNRPDLYSRYSAGASLQLGLIRGVFSNRKGLNLFLLLFSRHEPPLHAGTNPVPIIPKGYCIIFGGKTFYPQSAFLHCKVKN